MPFRDTPVRFNRDALGAPEEVVVESGDLLYVPRSYPHEPYTADTSSLHVTLGLFPEHWHSLLQTALRIAAERDARFREALPPEQLGDAEVRRSMAERFRKLTEQ